MTSEKNFQAYFVGQVPHCYRTALTTGGGFPDCLVVQGEKHSLVELKILEIGPSGNKKLKGLFKKAQPPWYWQYLSNGGKRLFVVFRLNDGYGVLRVDHVFLRALDTLTYKDMQENCWYFEYSNLKDLIHEHFS